MAPKKKTKILPTIRSDFLASLPRKLSGPSNLTSEQLLRAYGLAQPRNDAGDDEILNRVCPNKWVERSTETIVPMKPPSPIIPDSEDEDDDEVQIVEPESSKASTSKKSTAKGKGKAKDLCCLEHCVGNPRCLNWLGQDKWENSEKALEALKRNIGMGADPANPREPNTPVGLKNLGATCYANSFLQVWFQDETFRAGVYACLPPANGNIKDSPLYQLQVLFAFLQNSKQAVYNPEPLVSSLKLDKGEQQDSQEFSKLFMSLLDHEFKKQGNRSISEGEGGVNVATLVEDQFEGKVTYGIKCNQCHKKSERHSTFLELAVVLKKDCKLEEQLRESLKSEAMIGDNQYFCDNCSEKRDAVSSTVLNHLPPVLHISLLRFVFSYKDFTRSKSTHAMAYPLKLDMGQFLPTVNGKHVEEWYDLRGVLMHKGTSAHHGHYVAQVRDGSTDKWYLFDDESVTPIEDLNAPDRYDAEEEEVVAKRPKIKKVGFGRSANGDVLPKSKDAYMLIYAKREVNKKAQGSKPAQPDAPPLASAEVENLDFSHDTEAGIYLTKEMAVTADFKKLLEQKRSVYQVWDIMEDDEESYLVDKTELRRWMESDLPVIKPKSKKTDSPIVDLTKSAAGTSNATDVKNSGTSALAEDAEMEDPILDADDAGLISPTVIDCDGDIEIVSEDIKGKGKALEVIHIEAAGINSTPPTSGSLKLLENVDVMCSHNMAAPGKAEDMKRISQLGVMALQELGAQIIPQLSVRTDLCRECVWGIASEEVYRKTHAGQVERFVADVDTGDGVAWISKAWYNDWIKEIPSMHKEDTFDDPAPDSEEFKAHVICQHNKLQANNKKRRLISEEAAAILASIFPSWDAKLASESVSCKKCLYAYEKDTAQVAADKAMITAEKKIFKSFDNQLRLSGNKVVLVDGHTSYAIPKAFVREWVNWIRGKGVRPGDIDSTHLFCKHNRLLVDLAQEIESPQEIEVVNEKEWKLLVKEYSASPVIKIFAVGHEAASDPEVCQKCLEKKRQDFASTTIKVRSLTADDFETDGSRKVPAESSRPASPTIIKGQQTYGKQNASMNGSRTSRRIAEKPGMMKAKGSFDIEIVKSDTVKDLKVKIDTRMDIATIYQRLFLDGRELENDETVEGLGLCVGSNLELFEVKDLLNIDDLDDSVPDNVRSKKARREEGFGGTGLSGWESSENRMDVEIDLANPFSSASGSGSKPTSKSKKRSASSPAREEREPSFTMEIQCPICTLIQVVADKCSVCDSELIVPK